MELMELMKARYSARAFTAEQLTAEQLDAIIESAHIAPSAVNRQPWRFVVIQSEEGLAKVDECSKCRYGAPTAILICFKDDEAFGNAATDCYGWIDCSLATMQMCLVAKDLGLDTCIVGAYDPQKARELFNVPEGVTPFQFLMVGHADMGPSDRHEICRPLDEIVFPESF